MSPNEKPAFSLSGLSIEDDTFTSRAGTDNELTPAMQASYDARTTRKDGRWIGSTKSVKVPAQFAAKVEGLARAAADGLGYGARIEFTTLEGVKLERYSIGGTAKPLLKDGKPVLDDKGKPRTRMSGGTPAVRVKETGKQHTGMVKVKFAAGPPQVKKGSESEPTATEAPALVP